MYVESSYVTILTVILSINDHLSSQL